MTRVPFLEEKSSVTGNWINGIFFKKNHYSVTNLDLIHEYDLSKIDISNVDMRHDIEFFGELLHNLTSRIFSTM